MKIHHFHLLKVPNGLAMDHQHNHISNIWGLRLSIFPDKWYFRKKLCIFWTKNSRAALCSQRPGPVNSNWNVKKTHFCERKTTFIRVFLSFIANNLFKGTLGIQGILTVSSFYRLYQGSVLLKLQSCYGEEIIERKGFESMVELLMKLVFVEASISEVPMVLNSDLRKGKSKMKKLPTIMGYFTLLREKKRWQKTAHDMFGKIKIL